MMSRVIGILCITVILLTGCTTYTAPRPRPLETIDPKVAQLFQVDQSAATPSKSEESETATPEFQSEAGMVVDQREESALTLEGVLSSVDSHFPELTIARVEIEAAEARILEAQGAFDTLLTVDSKNILSGFYEYRLLDVAAEQRIDATGAIIKGGYRYGLGGLASYDGDLQTNAGGEAFVAAEVPILRDRGIDKERAKILKAQIEREAAHPRLVRERIRLSEKATEVYWKTVAAAAKLQVAEGLLELARTRQDSFAEQARAGQLPEIVITENESLVAQRQALVVAATRDFEKSALALSLYLRDANGVPLRVTREALPDFPEIPEIPISEIEGHIAWALRTRPEINILEAELSGADIDRALRENDLLPRLDTFAFASQDLGDATTSQDVDGQFEFGLGVSFELPINRRAARGGLAAAEAKIRALRQKLILQRDKVEAEIRDAASAYIRAREELIADLRTAEIAQVLEQAERDLLEAGQIDLLRVNLREQATAQALSSVISARVAVFAALANYRAAMGLGGPRANSTLAD